jgi:DMSO/TMAO reductase YedYZ molybdopterin-dependent catalytic subunit
MPTTTRRTFLKAAGAASIGAPALAQTATLPFENGERSLAAYPQKRALLRLTSRPPQLETPFAVFDEAPMTPNDAFFVRYHLGGAPPVVDPDAFRLSVNGSVDRPISLSLRELMAMPHTEVAAVNQCSGNGRGFFTPRVGGGQAGNGMMGNAVWKGTPLKGVLERAGVKASAVQVSFNGLDKPLLPTTPDFVKALDIQHALDGDVMLAWSMNGQDLPVLNGYPLRLVVPGWYGTYWVKHLSEIVALDQPLDNFWMSSAYRVLDNDCACAEPGAPPAKTRPISRLNVRSFITNLAADAQVAPHRATPLRGIAFDGGSGIAKVEVSTDGGANWKDARLGADHGRFAFRPWSASVRLTPGSHVLMARATSHAGESQPMVQRWNPSGYMRNVVEAVPVRAV